MNEYDIINAYLLYLYNPNAFVLQRIIVNYDVFLLLVQWFNKNDVSLPFVKELTQEKYVMYQKMYQSNPKALVAKEEIQALLQYKQKQYSKYHVLFIAGSDMTNEINQSFTNQKYVSKFQDEKIQILSCNQILDKEEYSFYGPHNYFLKALYQVEQWPGILIMKEENSVFYPISSVSEVETIFEKIEDQTIFNKDEVHSQNSYFIQLSDLHLGTKNRLKGKKVLEDNLDKLYHSLPDATNVHFLITGDLMNSPNRKNMYEASSFMNMLKRKYHSTVTFILGNHDVIVHGMNFLNRQKAKVVAYLLGENIRVLEHEKIIIIKMNSMVEGNLARGKVGKIQLQEIDDELASIKNINDYTLVAILHHHVVAISKDDFLKTKWHEKIFVGKIIESSKALVDAKEVNEWLQAHQVKYVFHGHKHIPFFTKENNMYIIAGGSSCGGGADESKSRYLSYNVLKYNQEEMRMQYCFVFYIDITKQERQRIKVHFFKEGI